MKRPPQLWVLSIGILCLSLLPSTNAVRATSLIFAKTTTTTTSTEAPAEGEVKEEAATVASETNVDNQTVTRPPLTGNPQIDYIWDPNLPFELKNYNLSDYPFYDGLPEDIDFKCDGLHDGFYASVVHKCQVYHHCLFGTRFDFLCANFTAFDQKTFICHFASEVDCANSKKFWHRNDALYKAAETTTITPVTTSAIPFTPSPALNPALRRPSPALAQGGGARRRRPYRRRRPQYEYYYDDEEYDVERGRDDYYDDPPVRNGGRRRNKRPRPNRRPEYEEYEEYEDDRYDRRPGRRDEDRRPYDRREDDRRRPTGGSKTKDRKTEDEDDHRPVEDRKRPVGVDDRRRPVEDEYERRPYDRRKPPRDRYDDEDREEDRRRPYDRKKPEDEERRYRPKDSKVEDEERRYRPKDSKMEDDRDDRRNRKPVDEGRWKPKTEDRTRSTEEPKVLIKPSSGSSVYDRPRAPPIIRRPVPKTERDKFNYKSTAVIKAPAAKLPEDEEYYDDYEDEPKLPPPKPTRKSTLDSRESEERRVYARPRRPQIVSKKPVAPIDEVEEAPRRSSLLKRPSERSPERTRDQDRSQERPRDQDRSQQRPRDQDRSQERPRDQDRSREQVKPKFEANSDNKKTLIQEEEYVDEYEEVKTPKEEFTSRERSRPKFISKENRESSVRPETTSKDTTSREREHRPEPVIKIVKRPFLPSRGGNPYVGRGLQPVGSKALDITTDTTEKRSKEETQESQEQIENSPRPIDNLKPIKPFLTQNKEEQVSKKTSQEEVNKSNEQSKLQSDEYYDDEEFKPVTSRPKNDFRNFNLPRTTQKPKVPDNYRNPLDINENEYDVTLNDALNPTLPNLPVRSVPTGFSNGREGYIAQNYQRPRLIPVESAVLSSASSDYVYQVKQPQNTQVQALRYNPYVTVQQLNYRQSPASSGQYYTTY